MEEAGPAPIDEMTMEEIELILNEADASSDEREDKSSANGADAIVTDDD